MLAFKAAWIPLFYSAKSTMKLILAQVAAFWQGY